QHFEPRKNTVYARFLFWQRNQAKQEPCEKWITDLKSKANECEFGAEKDNMLRDKIVFGVQDQRVKERACCGSRTSR
ncbi:hypothetical protein CAPTEDRAFT_115193, partial [Capitella teleta]